MREHIGLFRGKRLSNGKWMQGNLLQYSDGTCCICHAVSRVNHYKVVSSTVGECTGLKDKNGKLIFEGDIIKSWLGKILTVEFGQYYDEEEMHSGCGWYVTGEYGTLSFDERWGGHEIIGNIHDNPELLKGGE